MERINKIERNIQAAARFVQKRAEAIVSPTSHGEDKRRQELILNIILFTSIILLTILAITIVHNQAIMGTSYDGVTLTTFIGIILIFSSLFILSKNGYARVASYILIGLYAAGALYCGYRWGTSLPATLLTSTLVIFASSILIGTRFGLIMSMLMSAALLILGIHEINYLGVQAWKYKTVSGTDIVTYSGILFFITTLSWLSNRETDRSLKRARNSEKMLEKERDNLEITVKERTEELRRGQFEQMSGLTKIAEFGKLSEGLFHDLMAPLTSISLGLEAIQSNKNQDVSEIRTQVDRAVNASQRMSNCMTQIRTSMRPTRRGSLTDLDEAIAFVNGLLQYKSRQVNARIILPDATHITFAADQIHLERILLNLLSNAIDSYSEKATDATCPRHIIISVQKILLDKQKQVKIQITDYGCGISQENMEKIFTEFFSTKTDGLGTGIGLTIVKEIVEKELGGTIAIQSNITKGTSVTVTIPHDQSKSTHIRQTPQQAP